MKSKPKLALVLSGGGLYGAWQVGAWSVLERVFAPDLVVGASIGALNGWAIAAGGSAQSLLEHWKRAGHHGRLKFRLPMRGFDGVIDFTRMEGFIRELHAAYRPRREYYAVVTEVPWLKCKLIPGSDITWRHLAASCAIPVLLPGQRIDERTYIDGGFLGACPIWAAEKTGATHVIALNVMPVVPWPVRASLQRLRSVAGPRRTGDAQAVELKPSRVLGTWKQALSFEDAPIDAWFEQGRQDMEAAITSETFPLRHVLSDNTSRKPCLSIASFE